MSEPQLRCLLCDLVLAEDTTPAAQKEKCRRCSRDILVGQKVEGDGAAESLEEIPLAKVMAPTHVEPPIVPTVRRTTTPADVPYARKPATRQGVPSVSRPYRPEPLESRSRPDVPRPKVIQALGVLGCMTILAIICISVIAFSVLYGLTKARRASTQLTPHHQLMIS